VILRKTTSGTKSRRRIYSLMLVSGLALPAAFAWTVAVPPPAGAATKVQGSCWDLKAFDGLDTRYSASLCGKALSGRGWSPGVYDNKGAANALERTVADGAFYFAGHSVLDGNKSGQTAAGLVFQSPGPGSTPTVLLGDSRTAPDIEGAAGLCSPDTGKCIYGTIVAYPWAQTQLVDKENLMVLAACQTAHASGPFTDMTTVLHNSGVGTAVGFSRDVYSATSPDASYALYAWAKAFWADLGKNYLYTTALVDGANAQGGSYGYDSYVEKQNPGAPSRLSPAQYYVKGKTVDTPTRAASPRQIALFNAWIDGRRLSAGRWSTVPSADGAREQAYLPGVGLVQRSKASGETDEAIFEPQLQPGPPGAAESRGAAVATARQYARAHFFGFARLARVGASYVDHGAWREYRVTWQARRGQAWLPDIITVGINAGTGKVAYFWSERGTSMHDTSPLISAAQALRSARAAAGFSGRVLAGRPRLEVIDRQGRPQLEWLSRVTKVFVSGAAHVPASAIVAIDARTGRTTVIARAN
jgi:hypothetical protein